MMMVGAACRYLPATEETPIPPIITEAPPLAAHETLVALREATIPERDLAELAVRLRRVESVPRTISKQITYNVGDDAAFWYQNHDTGEVERINAHLAYRSAALNLWLEEGQNVEPDNLRAAASTLEKQILPTNRAFFGPEWQPGIDRDPRLNILHLKSIGGNVAGYFSAADEFVSAVNPYSNEREILYVSLESAPLGSDTYYGVIAHEMQHMIHWHTDSNEATWLDEGMAVLAGRLNGYGDPGFEKAFAARPDVQLNNFDYESASTPAHYGAAYLFAAYFLDRFGEAATQSLVRHPENGLRGVEATLLDAGFNTTFAALYADWVVATYLDSHGRGTGIYQFHNLSLPMIEPELTLDRFPASHSAVVNQYGTDFIRLRSDAPLTVTFTGTQQVQLLNTNPHSGDFLWSTIPADDSDMTLTGRFDLSHQEKATLTFWCWYEIESGWDYAYVAVSMDEGQTWHLLETEHTTLENPQGNSYGPGLTGNSGSGEMPQWVQQTADLSAYAGRPVLVRFEMITDDTVHGQGLAIDDIAIPELAFRDDVEEGAGNWEAAGFVRHGNVLPQAFLVQAILPGAEGAQVKRLSLHENQRGRWTVPLNRVYDEAVLAVSGLTPVTTLPASYTYSVAK